MISFSHVLSDDTVRFLFTGTNSAETANCVCVFVGAMFAHVYARAGKSSLFNRFLGSLPITIESFVHF